MHLNMPVELEIYHYSQLSQYLTAVLEESSGAISVVNIGISSDARTKLSCLNDALSVSSLETILVKDIKDIGNVWSNMMPAFNMFTPSPSHISEKCRSGDKIFEQVFLIPTSSHMEAYVDHFLSQQKDTCEYKKALIHSQSDLENASSTHRSIRMMKPSSQISMVDYYFNAHRFMLLDRPINWVAFDGGVPMQINTMKNNRDLEENYISFNSLNGALKSSQEIPIGLEMMVNIDLVTTADGVHVGMHDAKSFGPYAFEANQVPGTSIVSSMNFDQVRNVLRNPCVPADVTKMYLVLNKYYRNSQNLLKDNCSIPVNSIDDFLQDTSLLPELILDLKSSNETYDQGLEIIKSIMAQNFTTDDEKKKKISKISMRYFSYDKDRIRTISEIMPDYLFDRINNGNYSSNIKLFMNSPSIEACYVLAHWMLEKKLIPAGCFVQLNNVHMQDSWNYYSMKITNVPPSNVLKNLPQSFKIICDIPQQTGTVVMWNDGLTQCIENGYKWMHSPLSPTKADQSLPQNPEIIQTLSNEKSVIKALQEEETYYGTRSEFPTYRSHWGLTSPFHWKSFDQQWEFNGHILSPRSVSELDSSLSIFRCVSKILTVMLYLKLEELGLLRMDDQVEAAVLDSGSSVTWRQIFTNTAGDDGSNAGKEFVYSNSMWVFVEAFVAKVTGKSFKEAMDHYITSPMGLNGHFDDETEYTPFPARGFVGTNEDLMIIGGTLGSHGVSPKTRTQIIKADSAKSMLKDWTKLQNVTSSFLQDKTVESMNRFRHKESEFQHSIVDGYGMGLWCVKGWRVNRSTGELIVGWLAMGSSEALLYFDTDSIVVTMTAQQRVKGLELTTAFAKLIRSM